MSAARPAFVWHSRAWYADKVPVGEADAIDEIIIGLNYPDGGCIEQFAVRWYSLTLTGPEARLEVFAEAWPLLMREPFAGLLRTMAGQVTPRTPEALVAELLAAGFVDDTRRTKP